MEIVRRITSTPINKTEKNVDLISNVLQESILSRKKLCQANRHLHLAHGLIYRRDLGMLSQALFSALLIAGCLVVYEMGIWKRPAKRLHPPR